MAGGMNSRNSLGVPIGVRAGVAEPSDARPWENASPSRSAPPTVQPRSRHVLAEVAGDWLKALALELPRDGDEWSVRAAYVLPGGVLRSEWLPMRRVRPPHPR